MEIKQYMCVVYRNVKSIQISKSSLNAKVTKGKAVPLQAWTGPQGSRQLRFPDFRTVGP